MQSIFSNLTISRNIISTIGGTSYGIYIDGGLTDAVYSYNTITVSGIGSKTISISGSVICSINIIHNSLTSTNSNNGGGIYAISAFSNSQIYDNNITSSSTSITLGGGTLEVSNNTFEQVNITNKAVTNIGATTTSINNTFLNCSLNQSQISVTGTSNLTVKWYSRINVTDNSAQSINATILVNDTQNNIDFSGNANLTNWFIVSDNFYASSGVTSLNNHTVTVSLSGYATNSSLFNLSTQDITVNITMYLSSYSFTISYPVQTSECDFNPTSKTQTCVMCDNETSLIPMYVYTNTGSGNNNWNMSLDSNPPTCMSYSVKTGSDSCSTATNLTTTEIQLYSNILPSETKNVWAYMNFTACTPQTGTRINNNIGIG